jgi:hypothetical protein
MLEPSSQDLIHGASILNHRCEAFSVEPPSWSLLHKALIQNKYRAFVRGLRSGSLSEVFVLGLRSGPSSKAFIPYLRLCPEPSSWTFSDRAFVVDLLRLSLRREIFSGQPSSEDLLPPTFFRRPSPAGLYQGTFSS